MPPQNPFRNRKAVVSGLSCTQAEIATPFKCRSLDWIQCFDCHSQDFNSFPLNASQWETGRSDVSKKQHQGNTQTGWKCFPCEISGCRIYLRPANVWFEQVQCSNGGPFAKLKGLKNVSMGVEIMSLGLCAQNTDIHSIHRHMMSLILEVLDAEADVCQLKESLDCSLFPWNVHNRSCQNNMLLPW